MQNGQLFQQVMWEPVTAESEFGSLPTHRTCSAMAASVNSEGNFEGARSPNLETVIGRMLPTPAEPQAPTSSLKCWSAEDRILPTPLARDWKGVGRANQLPTVLAPTGAATYLNPSFVEEMMGYPIGWTELSN